MRNFISIALAASATSVVAQSSISTVIQYYSSCSTSIPPTGTNTGSPMTHSSMTHGTMSDGPLSNEPMPHSSMSHGTIINGTMSHGPMPQSGEVLTTYTTVFKELCTCPETYTQRTHMVTEVCPSESAGQHRGSNYIPPGFAVTTTTCHVCAETPVTATLTMPTPQAPTMANKAPVANAPAPTSPPSSPEAGMPGSPAGAAAAPAGQPASGAPVAPAAGGTPDNAAPKDVAPASGDSAPAVPAADGAPNAAAPAAGGVPDTAAPGSGGVPDAAAPAAGGVPDTAAPASGTPEAPAPGAAPPPYPIPSASGTREAAAPSGSAGSGSSITPFTGAASRLSTGASTVMALVGLAYIAL